MEKDNSLKTAEPSTGRNANTVDAVNHYPMAPPIPVPYVKPLDKVKELPPRKRSRAREER